MANQLRQQIEQISREKNINPEVIIAAIEDAILTASKKYYKGAEDLRSRFNEESGQIEVFAVKQVVEAVEIPETQLTLDEARQMFPGAEIELGQEIEFPKPTDVLGRIAAQEGAAGRRFGLKLTAEGGLGGPHEFLVGVVRIAVTDHAPCLGRLRAAGNAHADAHLDLAGG